MASGDENVPIEVFRTAELVWVGRMMLVAVIVIGLVAVVPMLIVGIWLPAALTTMLVVAADVLVYRSLLRARLVAEGDGIVVVNPFHTWRLRWEEIARFDARRSLAVTLMDGSVVRSWAVQTPNVAGLLGREADSDVVARRLNELLRGRNAMACPSMDHGPEHSAKRSARRRAAFVTAAVFFTYFLVRLALALRS
jgi:hypothetical protein